MRRALLLALLLASCADRLDGKTAGEWTAELMDDERALATRTRLEGHGKEALDVLVAILNDAPPKARTQAALVLAHLGPAAAPAVPALVEALKAPDRALRGMSAIALGRIGAGARDAVVPLDRLLTDRDARVRVGASLAIYGITGDTAAPTRVLYGIFTSKDTDIRAMVAEAFTEMGMPVTGFLVKSLTHEDESIRVSAARTLGAMGPGAAEAKAALQRALEDPSEAVRAAAAEALTKIGPQ